MASRKIFNLRYVILFFFVLIMLPGCSKEKADWNTAKSMNTIESYESFISKYPSSIFAIEARKEIEKINYREAESLNTAEAYEKFIHAYPNGAMTYQARQGIYYLRAKEKDTIAAYEEFLKMFSNGRFVPRAKSAIRAKKTGPFTATITDIEGVSWNVKEIKSFYRARGMWLGEIPTVSRNNYDIVLRIKEGHVTTEEKITLPFYMIKSISYPEARILQIEKRDGTSIRIQEKTKIFESFDTKNMLQKRIHCQEILYSGGTTQGMAYILKGFKGRSKSESGKIGDFFIKNNDIKNIVFK